jgi:superfamily II DNA or RNA helicase
LQGAALIDQWFYSPDHRQICRVIEEHPLWGEPTCRIWLPGTDSVVRVQASRLEPLAGAPSGSPDEIAYVAAAARVADGLAQDVLLAPIESSVIPLPHQIRALSKAIASDRVRYLLADEVGLGKTIEAGLILRELKLRGLVKRAAVIAPKGLVTQWVSEMHFHFGEHFQLVLPEDLKTLRRIPLPPAAGADGPGKSRDNERSAANPWRLFSQVVVPMDSVKPLDKRRGWTSAQVGEFNRERFEDLISAGWDLVIVDEAHRLGGSTDQVARFRLGQGLSEAAPYLLLLSATPHQGKTDAFYRLLSLVDAKAFPDAGSVTRERVQPYVIRTEKRQAIDAEGKPLFKPRRTELAPIRWEERHHRQQLLYEAVTEYAREGYNQALRDKQNYVGFLMILMQRLVVSSTRAIRTTLARRLEALAEPQEQQSLLPGYSEEEWADLDGEEQIETLLRTRLKALKNERAEVEVLLEAAGRCEEAGADAKAEALLDWIYRMQAAESDPDVKLLVFTEFVPTQEMLRGFLSERGFTVATLNGSMGMEERKRAQEAFARDARVLISTDAGGEGLNLQFCHVVINYDIPWNPMRLEQRIGRVDRIGQSHRVRAVNFVFQDSVEHHVREILEEKLAIIFEEFGIDKTGDVLDSAQAGRIFDELYVEAILKPESVEDSVESVLTRIQQEAQASREAAFAFSTPEGLDPAEAQRLLSHPLPHWVERMTVSYLRSHSGKAERKQRTWDLVWPDGEVYPGVVFTAREAEDLPAARHLTLEEPRVRGIATRLPRFVSGQPIRSVMIPGVATEIDGIWSLWQISIASDDWNRRRIMALFVAEGGKVYPATARHIWDQLLTVSPVSHPGSPAEASEETLHRLEAAAEEQGRTVYDGLVQEHRTLIERERQKAEYAFAARRKGIQRIGLAQVRNHRLGQLVQEEQEFNAQFDRRAQAYPEMVPLIVIRVRGGSHG